MENTSRQSPTASPAPLLARINEGHVLVRQGQMAEAAQLAERVASEWPEHAAAHGFAAEVHNLQGRFDVALTCIDRAIESSSNPHYRIKKAWLLSRAHRRDEIPALASQLAGEAEGNPQLLWQLGKLYFAHNLMSEAVEQYERSLKLIDAANVRYDAALARFYSGDAAQAERDLDRVLSGPVRVGSAVYLRSTLRKQRPDDNHIAELESWLKEGIPRPEDEAAVLYALAKELEDVGEHERSFACLVAGAGKRRKTLSYDVTEVVAGLREIIDSTHVDAMEAVASGCGGEGAIFIVGMPRTGTTLTERLLLQSGRVKNAGELVDFENLLAREVEQVRTKRPELSPTQAALQVDFASLGECYMRIARQMAGGSPSFIDKMPVNFLYCGMIRKALPAAKIIHVTRDPLDTCFAIYKTLFFRAYEFSYDMGELAEYYAAYHRMMRHWHDVMPGEILDVRYEDLVTNTELQARRLYDWCGLEWTDAALAVPEKHAVYATASAAQVREPVHSKSIGSSRRHLAKLAPLFDRLVAAGVISNS